ncbi:hypothetical protein D9758_011621 [Tetrapyrgos nigripes]|uniref:Reverse transcriptase domain-containing protein n=1 Tax=Tetrapyrgos nigripes TaxID=182062 RepID=A0A8H5FSF8_9AGAR|nr:hypothetical protein D9758_011621 [Tetrapyrgos nigripes]
MVHTSDHLALKWMQDSTLVELENITGKKYSLKDTKEKDWLAAFEDELFSNELHILSDDPTNIPTREQIDLAADALVNAFQQANQKTGKLKKPSAHAKPWWDETVTAAFNRVQLAKRAARRSRLENGHVDYILNEVANHEARHTDRLLRWKKRTFAQDTLEKAATNDIYSFRKWSAGDRNYPTPAIDRPGRTPATTHQEKCDALRNELYQPPPQLPDEYHTDFTPRADDLPCPDVTETEVREVLEETSNTSAPGPSQGYFDFVNHGRLIHQMRSQRVPVELVSWTESFLADRHAAICVDGKVSAMEPVANGVPQGSPVSPILAAFYSSELLELIENDSHPPSFTIPAAPAPPPVMPYVPSADEVARKEAQKAKNLAVSPTKTSGFMYVDDGMIFVSSESPSHNTAILHDVWHRVIAPWCKHVGLTIDVAKRELMHYRKPRSKANPIAGNPRPPLLITDPDGVLRMVYPSTSIRWLGVIMDETLSFNFHVKHLITNAGKALGALFMLGNTRRGLSPYHMRLLYVTCVTPVMTYASAVWWTGKVQHEKLLTRIQNRALRLICASFRTTPIDAMEVEASIPPIRITLDGLSHACALRYNKLSVTNPVIQRLPDWHSTDRTITRARGNVPPTSAKLQNSQAPTTNEFPHSPPLRGVELHPTSIPGCALNRPHQNQRMKMYMASPAQAQDSLLTTLALSVSHVKLV